jgi:hypothetical protein
METGGDDEPKAMDDKGCTLTVLGGEVATLVTVPIFLGVPIPVGKAVTTGVTTGESVFRAGESPASNLGLAVCPPRCPM